MHKGFKCPDISTGRVYISRDVVFDESYFPFAHLHHNARALLCREIVLLPNNLRNLGDVGCLDHITNPTNCVDNEEVHENSESNSALDGH